MSLSSEVVSTESSSDSMALTSGNPMTEFSNSFVTESLKERLNSPYNDQCLGPGEIRLLSITTIPSTKPSLRHVYPWLSGKLDLHLTTKRVILSARPNFTAVSYVWGTLPAKVDVSCNSSSLLVTQSCYNMLVHLSAYQDDYWIDAICIDQSSATEKAAQIPFMRNIYAQAACVLLYMGPAREITDAFMLDFPRVLELARTWTPKHGRKGDANWRGDDWPGDNSMFWVGYYYILNQEWFRRLWTFQEAVLARKALIVCGYREIDMNAFVYFHNVGYSEHEGYAPWRPDIARRVARDLNLVNEGIITCTVIRWLRMRYQKCIESGAGLPSVDLPMLIFELRYTRVKELVDRVWSIVGLMNPEIQKQLALVIDYSERGRKEYWRTYIRFAKTVFMSGSLHLLNLPPHMGRTNKHVPSWCPNLSERPCCLFIMNCKWNRRGEYGNWAADGLLESETDEETNAKRNAILNHPRKFISVSEDEQILSTCGFIVDTVSEVASHPLLIGEAENLVGCPWPRPDIRDPVHDAFFAFYRRALALARRTIYGTEHSTSIPPQYLMSLMLDCGISELAESAYRHAWTTLTRGGNYFEEVLDSDQRLSANGMVNRLVRLAGHSFFITESGRLGVANPGCRPGDKVCAFYGGEPLYILHRADAEGAELEYGNAEFFGVAFVPHLMEQYQRDEARLSEDEIFQIG
jgi:hypothetical protein